MKRGSADSGRLVSFCPAKRGDLQYGVLLALVLFFLLALTLFFIFKKMLAGGAP